MGLGIGLGGFAKGFGSGYDLGKEVDADIQKNRQKQATSDALAQGKNEYDAAVAAGQAQPNDPNGILRYAYPKMMKVYQDAGDTEGMQKVSDWIKSDNAKQGTQLFASGMLKGQNGDMGGALQDFLTAGRVQGFGNYKVGEPKPIEGGGISIDITDPKSGKTTTQEFKTADDVLKFGATYFNPEAQFKQWQEAQTEKSNYSRDVAKAGDTERARNSANTENDIVRKNLGIGDYGDDKLRQRAVDELKGTDAYKAADPTEQEQMISDRIDQMKGGGGKSKKVIVDSRTGKVIDASQ